MKRAHPLPFMNAYYQSHPPASQMRHRQRLQERVRMRADDEHVQHDAGEGQAGHAVEGDADERVVAVARESRGNISEGGK